VITGKQSVVFKYQVTWYQYNTNDLISLVEDYAEKLHWSNKYKKWFTGNQYRVYYVLLLNIGKINSFLLSNQTGNDKGIWSQWKIIASFCKVIWNLLGYQHNVKVFQCQN
jgi:hypothetical protein